MRDVMREMRGMKGKLVEKNVGDKEDGQIGY
jgi:hypothetical protein